MIIFGAISGMPEINGLLGIVTTPTPQSGRHRRHRLQRIRQRRHHRHRHPADIHQGRQRQDFTPDGGTANIIDVSNLDSTAKEKRQGLQDMGNYSLTFDTDDTDPVSSP